MAAAMYGSHLQHESVCHKQCVCRLGTIAQRDQELPSRPTWILATGYKMVKHNSGPF